jgi:hypothetical protein
MTHGEDALRKDMKKVEPHTVTFVFDNNTMTGIVSSA